MMPISPPSGRLLLAPQPVDAAPNCQKLQFELQALGLLGTQLTRSACDDTQPIAFTCGEQFFHFIAFTGCAVQLPNTSTTAATVPPCHLQLAGPTTHPRFFSGFNTRPPRCPVCGKAAIDWQQQIINWLENDNKPLLRCAACDYYQPGWQWQWGHHAGFGRVILSVEAIFPGEVMPLPALFMQLKTLTGYQWHWFSVSN
ncbi:hypothetical protein HUU62_03595 [Rhodoferax sp. 4810]|uniref:Uncharacterized protein n=1 Tax=Thiospirillum jenense TaxID=1653858 RepID=A0A839HGC8_9GAMM|nr:hypothetical protein [Thiospirillum jenense]MBB1073492.1 hypothetical protein [Rhodoferax jenense]MBB1125979.1 hypothetical protein [Thiospirillum jenense]